jgi:hypothetical protein
MGGVVSSIFGGGNKSVPAPSVAPTESLESEKKKAKKQRVALTATGSGIAGQELQPGQVKPRETLFGN